MKTANKGRNDEGMKKSGIVDVGKKRAKKAR